VVILDGQSGNGAGYLRIFQFFLTSHCPASVSYSFSHQKSKIFLKSDSQANDFISRRMQNIVIGTVQCILPLIDTRSFHHITLLVLNAHRPDTRLIRVGGKIECERVIKCYDLLIMLVVACWKGACDSVVVKALYYKSEDCGFETQ
jgi:hypothetical protein